MGNKTEESPKSVPHFIWGEAETKRLIELRNSGKTCWEIAIVLGRTAKSVNSKLQYLGHYSRHHWSVEEKQNIEKSSRSKIAKKIMRCRLKK